MFAVFGLMMVLATQWVEIFRDQVRLQREEQEAIAVISEVQKEMDYWWRCERDPNEDAIAHWGAYRTRHNLTSHPEPINSYWEHQPGSGRLSIRFYVSDEIAQNIGDALSGNGWIYDDTIGGTTEIRRDFTQPVARPRASLTSNAGTFLRELNGDLDDCPAQ